MKTAMQELLEFVKYKINNDPATEYGRVYSEVFRQVKREIEDKYLESEKEQIMEAWESGYSNGVRSVSRGEPKIKSSEEYYNSTFKSDE